MKRVLSMLMALVLVFTMLPIQAMATEPEPETSVDTGDLTVESSNGFGTLLSQEIQESQEEIASANDDYEAGYAVTNLTFDGATATVEYSSLEEAILVVAVYSEDGMQMLASGDTVVNPDEFVTTVTIEGDMPEYFLASAYLMDTYDLSPLCAAYDTPMYTQEMQELVASTVDDYDEEKVLNFDDDESTNFAIYADSTIILEGGNGMNNVTLVDDENLIYVIENPDETVTGLQTGDVFVYPYGEDELLIVKVSELEITDNLATITGDENLEMEEVFSYAKIENTGTTSDMIVDEDGGDEGVTYEGMIPDPGSDINPSAWDDAELEASIGIKLKKDLGKNSSVSGSLNLKLFVELEYYITLKRQFIRFETGFEFYFKGEFKYENTTPLGKTIGKLKLVPVTYPVVAGITIGFNPQAVFEFEGTVTFTATVSGSIGFSFESGKGIKDLSQKPVTDIDINFEGTLFFGIDLAPNVAIVHGKVAKATLSSQVGLELTGKLKSSALEDIVIWGEQPEERHDCKACLSIEVALKAEFKASLVLLKKDWLTFERELAAKRVKLGLLYISFTHNDVGWGECPHKLYRLTVETTDRMGTPFINADVTVGDITGTTNDRGVYVVYLPAGTYSVSAEAEENYKAAGRSIKLTEATKIALKMLDIDGPDSSDGFWCSLNPGEITDSMKLLGSGECGTNVTWKLYDNGLLTISGTGPMADYGSSDTVPWDSYSSTIRSVVIEHGVSSIGDYAFDSCYYLSSVKIPNSVTSIGNYAFYYCHNLGSVKIPDSVIFIGKYAFYDCNNLSSVEIPNSVTSIGDYAFGFCTKLAGIYVDSNNPDYSSDSYGVLYNKQKTTLIQAPGAISGSYAIPDSVTTIDKSAFSGCYSLTNVEIPDSVTTIGVAAFEYCDSLTSILIGNSVTSIGKYAFYDCNSLSSVEIPDSVTSIGDYAFYWCRSLSSVEIGSGVTSIGERAFTLCGSLAGFYVDENNQNYSSDSYGVLFDKQKTTLIQASTVINGSYVIPDSVTTIEEFAFENCTSLSSVVIPESVTTIRQGAFNWCSSLSRIKFTGNPPSIGERAFYDVTATAYYPANNPTWTAAVMKNYGGTITWVPYTLDGNGEMIVNESEAFTVMADPNQAPGETEPVDFEIEDAEKDAPTLDAVYGGEYGTEITDTYILKTASFTGLVPGQQYVLLAMLSIEVENPLAGDNLLYIDQAPAGEDGTLEFQYVQRTQTDTSYVMACGASNKDLNDAEITFPEMMADGEIQAVNPTVIYDGQTLTEGNDYTIVGSVSFVEPGEYTCYVRGVRNYTGLVKCVYTVAPQITEASGTCGDSLTWVIADGILTISGEGAMTDFTDGMEAPWMAHTDLFTSVVIEEGVTTVGIRAFANAVNVTSVELPISLTGLGEEAFYMSGLTELTLPPNLNYIGFKSMVCPDLTAIYVEDQDHATCYSRNGVLYTANSLVQVPGAYTGELELHSNTCNIWNWALLNCKNLTKLIVPANINQIGADILDGCTALTEIQFQGDAPGNVSENAFEGVTATISCPDANTTWTEEVKRLFGDGLTWTTHGENLVAQGYCGENAISNIPQVGTNADMPAGENATWTLTADGTMTISGEGRMGNFILFIGTNPWAAVCKNDPTRLTRVVIEEGITTVGEFAFADVLGKYITEVVLPSTMERIGIYAFAFCNRLEKIHLPEGIVEIGTLAFASCPALTEIQFVGDAPAIAENAFNGVVATAYYPENNPTWTEEVMQSYGGTLTWEAYTPVYSGVCGDNLNWTIEDGVLTVSGEGEMWNFGGDVSIPWMTYRDQFTSVVIEEGVTTVGDGAFGFHPITSVSLPETVTHIGTAAFSYTMNLTEVELPDSLVSIGNEAFAMSALTEVAIPASVEAIGAKTFICPNLTAFHVDEGNPIYYSQDGLLCRENQVIQVPAGYSGELELHTYSWVLGDYAMLYCGNVTKLILPANLNEIGTGVFAGCSSLTEIQFLGDAPATIAENVFADLAVTVSYPDANTTWTDEAKQSFGETVSWATHGENLVARGYCGENQYIGNSTIMYIPDLPAGKNAIWMLTSDGTMTISGTGRMVNSNPFAGTNPWARIFMNDASRLTKIVIEEGITTVGDMAFLTLGTYVTEVVLPSTVNSIRYGALASLTALERLEIPAGVTEIGEKAFFENTALSEVKFSGDAPTIADDAFSNVVATAYYPAGNPTWTVDVMKSYGGTITWKPIVEAKVVTSGWTGENNWKLYENGTLVIFGNGSMKNYGYAGGQPWLDQGVDITSVVIEDGVSSIGSGAFKDLTTLKSVTFPATTLAKMGEAAFYGSGLESVEIPASLWTIQPYTFKNCTNLTSVKFHEGNLQKISDGAFYGTGLTELVLPDCLDIMDVYAFKGCENLTSITIGSGLAELREAVFYGTAIPTITIPEGITKIGPYAFKNCVELESIGLPSTLTSVGEASFYDCTALKAIDLPDAVTSVGNYAFRRCTGLTSADFGENLVTIGECSFYGCTGLTELVIPDKVTTIKPYAFKTCTGLTSVTLGSKVATIGEGAFNTCTGLKTIVFPASLKTIGDYCFSGSYNLWKLSFEGDAPSIGTGAFKGLNAFAYYPEGNATWTSDMMQNYGGKVTWNEN